MNPTKSVLLGVKSAYAIFHLFGVSQGIALGEPVEDEVYEETSPAESQAQPNEQATAESDDLFQEVAAEESSTGDAETVPPAKKKPAKAAPPVRKTAAKKAVKPKVETVSQKSVPTSPDQAPVAATESASPEVPATDTPSMAAPQVASAAPHMGSGGESSLPSPESATAPASGEPALEKSTWISEGQPHDMQALGIRITAPKGWEVVSQSAGLSLIMREPKDPSPSYDAPKYQRNITMAVIHAPAPIDEKRAKELEAQLLKNFSENGGSKDFKILEHKFFNYKGENDGLLVYSSMTLGEFPMMQMHVLLGGSQKQFLFTYTDLANRFTAEANLSFQEAWSSIVGSEIVGYAPSRLELYKVHMIGGGLLLTLVGLLGFLRYRASKKDYKSDADEYLEAEDGVTGQAGLASTKKVRSDRTPGKKASQVSYFSTISKFGSFTTGPLTNPTSEFGTMV